jgi:hypothetical protein
MRELSSGHYTHEGYTILGTVEGGFSIYRPGEIGRWDDPVEWTMTFSEIRGLIEADIERCAAGDTDMYRKDGTVRREMERLQRIEDGEEPEASDEE